VAAALRRLIKGLMAADDGEERTEVGAQAVSSDRRALGTNGRLLDIRLACLQYGVRCSRRMRPNAMDQYIDIAGISFRRTARSHGA
jgi:hypothetical protein